MLRYLKMQEGPAPHSYLQDLNLGIKGGFWMTLFLPESGVDLSLVLMWFHLLSVGECCLRARIDWGKDDQENRWWLGMEQQSIWLQMESVRNVSSNNSKRSNRQRINLKNIQATPPAQLQKNKWSNQKMGQRTKQTLLQGRRFSN